MFAALTKALDWFAIELARRAVRGAMSGSRTSPELSHSADLFAGAIELPNRFQLSKTAFQFPSPIATPWAENNIVHGRLYRAGKLWRNKPAVVLLHGWNAEYGYHCQFPYLAWRLTRAGVNTVTLELPYHCRRRPRHKDAVRDFISADLAAMLEATRQAVADTRTLLLWLETQGCPSAGLWGFSLGAWLGGLVAAADPRLHFAVLLTPVVKIDRAIEELAFCEPIRRSLKDRQLPLAHLDLASHRPRIPPEEILLVESRHDLFAPAETVESLWRAWNQPEIWRINHGHISVLMSLPILERIVRWIARAAQRDMPEAGKKISAQAALQPTGAELESAHGFRIRRDGVCRY